MQAGGSSFQAVGLFINMDVVELEITSPDPIFFENIQHPENFIHYADNAMMHIMDEFKAEMEVYAPEDEANAPGRIGPDGEPLGWYERGRGWWYPIKRMNTLQLAGRVAGAGAGLSRAKFGKRVGVVPGKRVSGVVGYKLIPSSEQMGDRWVVAVITEDDVVIGRLFNGASYSDYVQGLGQSALMAERQWNAVLDIWNGDPMQGTIDREITDALDKFLE